MPQAAHPIERPSGFVRGALFDYTLLLGTTAIALVAGILVVVRPSLFHIILVADLWLLGYHHVIATFTRLTFDRSSVEQHRFLVFALPGLVLAATALLAWSFGVWAIATVYFYWQWFHYTRQSYGVERIYWRSAGPGAVQDRLTWHVIYLLPLWGVLDRSAQGAATGMTFLSFDVAWIPVPQAAANAVGVVTVGVLTVWVLNRVLEAIRGELRRAHTLYVVSHVVIFSIGYLVIDVVEHGWLTVNIWHNAQYMLIVWLFNTNRFKSGLDPSAPFLSEISQPANAWRYVGVTLMLTTLVYLGLASASAAFTAYGVAATVVIYQTANFHHYVVDSVVWKLRQKAVVSRLATG